MLRSYYICDDVRFGTETEGYNPVDNSFGSYHKLRASLGPAFEAAGIPFSNSGQRHFYTRWDLGTETTVYAGGPFGIGFELKSRILRGPDGFKELEDAHAALAEISKQPDGSYSFVTNETCSFQLHVSPADDRPEYDAGEPRIAGNFTERHIRNLAHAIAINEIAYKTFIEKHRLDSRFCKVYTSTEIPDGCTVADILNPSAMTIEQVTGEKVGTAMISLANLNMRKEAEDNKKRDPADGPPPPPIHTVQFRAKEGVQLSDLDGHMRYAAIMVNFVSLALNDPYVTLEEAERLTLHGPQAGQKPVITLPGPVL